MNAANATQVKMFANLQQNLFFPLTGEQNEAAKIHRELSNKGARIGFGHVKALLDGQEAIYKDFEVVTIVTHAAVSDAPKQQTKAQGRPVTVPQGNQTTKQASPPVGARGRGRSYEPSGEVKALKRGALYTRLMEFMMRPEGATMKYMLDHSGNKTAGGVNDVLSWQIKQRGYGLRFDQEKGTYHLVLPAGHKELTYKD